MRPSKLYIQTRNSAGPKHNHPHSMNPMPRHVLMCKTQNIYIPCPIPPPRLSPSQPAQPVPKKSTLQAHQAVCTCSKRGARGCKKTRSHFSGFALQGRFYIALLHGLMDDVHVCKTLACVSMCGGAWYRCSRSPRGSI